MVVNRTRGRSAFRLPDTVGPVEVVVYLFAPAVLAIPENALTMLLGVSPTVLFTVDLPGAPLSLTVELLRISGFLAVFSGLYFAVHAVTDLSFQEATDGRLANRVRRALAVRAVYYAVRDEEGDSSSSVAEPSVKTSTETT